MVQRWFKYFFILSCLFVFAYPVGRLSYWYLDHARFSLAAALVVWLVAMLALRRSFSGPNMKLRYLVVHWMGISFVFACLTLVFEAVRWFTAYPASSIALAVVAIGSLCTLVAVLLSHHLAVKHHKIHSHKIDRGYRIVHISDVHIGSRQSGFMRRIVNKVNALKPDFIVVTGDLIDSSSVDFDALEPISRLQAKTFFSIGNHERYADLPGIIDIAGRLGMVTLRQEAFSTEHLIFTGIDDAEDVNQVANHLPHIDRDRGKFNILLYHRPHGWDSAIEHGIDLMLSGHTHNGQIFPFNLLVKRQFKHIAGMYVRGDARLYVSSGTGTWGPLMRLGSLNEVTLHELIPKA